MVDTAYFDTMRIPLLRGRLFDDGDVEDTPLVALINNATADLYWPGEDPIGRRVSWGTTDEGERIWVTIVGVVDDVFTEGLDTPPRPETYRPFAQDPYPFMTFVLRTGEDPAAYALPLRQAVFDVDPGQPVSGVKTLDEVLAAALAPRRFNMMLMLVFAGVAVVLAAVGLFGMLSFSVSRRRHEIGIRRALGALPHDIAVQFISEGARMLVIGLAVGTAGALALAHLITAQDLRRDRHRPRNLYRRGAGPGLGRPPGELPPGASRSSRGTDDGAAKRMRGTTMNGLLTEIRFALRRLARNPSFSILVILTLALGIGATTTIFSVVDGVLLRELPYPDPGRLIQVRTHHKGRIFDTNSAANFLDYREQIESIDSVTFYQYRRWYLGETQEPRYVLGVVTSHEFFEVMGVAPALGRPFTADEERPDADVVVISHGFWQSHFGGLSDVIGRTVLLDARPFTVVGVMPAGFGFPHPEVEIWRPLWLDPTSPNLRSDSNLLVVARLAKGASLGEAQHEFTAYGERVADEYPQNYRTFQFAVSAVSLRTATVGTVQTPLVVLLGAVAFVLFIACANVANLLLVRYEARGYELAVRSALGASRARIVRQMLVESLVLALAGGLIGLSLTKLGLSGLLSLAGDAIPRADNVRLDIPVLAVTFAVSVLAGLLAGSLPSIRISAQQPGQTLCASGRSVIAGGRSVLRRSLVIAEVALAVMLVIGAFLMIRTLAALHDVDVGFRTDNVLTARVTLPQDGYRNLTLVGDFFRSLEERVRALPGVREVGTAWRLPLATGFDNLSIVIEGHEVATIGEAPTAHVQIASPGYFDALGLTPIQGRTFEGSDSVGRPFVAVVNRTFERQLLDGQQAVGTRVKLWGDDRPWMEIVGVVGDIHNDDLVTDPRPTVYFAHAQLLMDEIRPERLPRAYCQEHGARGSHRW